MTVIDSPVQTAPVAETESAQDAGLSFQICQTRDEVAESWELLYRVYLKVGFIAPNPYEMHTSACAIGSHTAVIQGRIGQLAVGTISAINDGPKRLPLDSAYPNELAELRSQGRKLIEVGLFGDRRENTERAFHTVLELMRYTFYFGLYSGATDFVCGIPPRRAKLYAHAFGFDIIGDAKTYATVQGNPVVLLHSNVEKAIKNRNRHRAIDYFLRNPMELSEYDQRFMFNHEVMQDSTLQNFCNYLDVQAH